MKFTSKRKSIKKKSAYDEKYLWPIFSLFTRFRDTDENGYGNCFTCGALKHYSESDAGHGISRRHKAVKYNECNCALQCKKCNGFEAGARDVYAVNVDKKYGTGTWDKLTVLSRQVSKTGQFEYDTMTDLYVIDVLQMAQKKGIDGAQLPAVKKWLNRKK